MTKLNLRPSKPASAGALFGLFFMLLFGIAFAVLVGNVLVENEAPIAMFIAFGLFMIGWVGAALFMLVYHLLNLKRAKGLPLVDIETEPGSQADDSVSDPMQKLRSLEALKHDGLISDDEFRRKREEIMQQKWLISRHADVMGQVFVIVTEGAGGFSPLKECKSPRPLGLGRFRPPPFTPPRSARTNIKAIPHLPGIVLATSALFDELSDFAGSYQEQPASSQISCQYDRMHLQHCRM